MHCRKSVLAKIWARMIGDEEAMISHGVRAGHKPLITLNSHRGAQICPDVGTRIFAQAKSFLTTVVVAGLIVEKEPGRISWRPVAPEEVCVPSILSQSCLPCTGIEKK
jgi:hypothetical protein